MKEIAQQEVLKLSVYKTYYDSLVLLQTDLTDTQRNEMLLLEKKIKIIDGWLGMLTLDERFVVQHACIDDLDWKRVEAEHSKRWGDNGKSARTLQSCLKSAWEKIVALMNQQKAMLIHLGIDVKKC